jgi:DNA-nicking Smr family endonuclease
VEFGDILDQWDNQTAKPQGKKAGGKTSPGKPAEKGDAKKPSRPSPPRPQPQAARLKENAIYDKDAEEPEIHQGKAAVSPGEKRRRLLLKKPDAVIDLHGLTRDEAWASLDVFFQDGKRRGFLKLAIIHGKGNHSRGGAILKHTVREYIERCPFAGESGFGDAASGGSGTTWILIK